MGSSSFKELWYRALENHGYDLNDDTYTGSIWERDDINEFKKHIKYNGKSNSNISES